MFHVKYSRYSTKKASPGASTLPRKVRIGWRLGIHITSAAPPAPAAPAAPAAPSMSICGGDSPEDSLPSLGSSPPVVPPVGSDPADSRSASLPLPSREVPGCGAATTPALVPLLALAPFSPAAESRAGGAGCGLSEQAVANSKPVASALSSSARRSLPAPEVAEVPTPRDYHRSSESKPLRIRARSISKKSHEEDPPSAHRVASLLHLGWRRALRVCAVPTTWV